MDDPIDRRPGVDHTRAHPARVYDYWLGGKDNFAADREVAEAMMTAVPGIPMMARANRDFLQRTLRVLVSERGIDQFLDVGSGIPTARNTHEVVQELAPAARVLYVDNDPVVAAHSRALLTGTHDGASAFLLADAREPGAILGDPVLHRTLDLHRPVGLMLVSVLMYFPDEVAHHIVRTLLAALPPGSHLTISHPTADFDPEASAAAVAVARRGGLTYITRSRAEVEAFFAGLELVGPGVVPIAGWRPELGAGPRGDERRAHFWGGVARKP
ncbi:SAM-dependent methyltransferase [Pseudonocardia humida]|uniref:SAM-dependent methyltransferase n=1 Tax=Pseudonocardia humida TaxID=2800819 RepID=A0ABT1A815_9PSEU|nr:SAM-dependent methyltransferase [Pseudonocardia humida]MCO1658979.1 SAM-dependent methyltransferase [Pseudonocardia humida]